MLLGLSVAACRQAPAAELEKSEARAKAPYTLRDLAWEAERAELFDGGRLISIATPDRHKYRDPLEGDWRALAFTDTVGGARRVVVRARSKTGARLTLQLDGEAIDSVELTPDFATHSFRLKAPLEPGRRTLTLAAAGLEPEDVEFVWLAEGAGPPPSTQRTELRVLGRPLNALIGDGGRTYAFFVYVRPSCQLRFSYGAETPALFEVRAARDAAAPEVLFSRAADGSRWESASIDLSPFVGHVVRLELETRTEGSAAWGEPLVTSSAAPPPRPVPTLSRLAKNVVLLVIDTARQDAFRPFNRRSTIATPAMDLLAEQGVVFENAYTNAPWTKPSAATLLTSLYPTAHGAQEQKSVLSDRARLLSEHLRDHDFSTAIFSANGYVSDHFGFGRGWDMYKNHVREGVARDAVNVFGDAIAWLEKLPENRRFFLYMQTIDPHVPYDASPQDLARYHPARYDGKIGESFSGEESYDVRRGRLVLDADDLDYIRALYYAEVTYHDREMGRFFTRLEEMGLLEDTIVVITNDHGEELMDHGKIGHGHSLYDELIRAPLLIRYPRLFRPGRSDAIVGLVDVAPTILATLGVPALPDAQGVPLLGVASGRPALTPSYEISEFLKKRKSVRLGRYKLIVGDETALFDLAADPSEQRDLYATRPLARRMLEQYLSEGMSIRKKSSRIAGKEVGRDVSLEAGDAQLDPELRAQLRALGYFVD